MDLHEKIRTLPTNPGVYLYKNAEDQVIYVGKAKNLRARVRNYFVERAAENAKTGSLLREAVDIEYIVVDNEKEALALENNLIKQKQPRFNILLRDDKTYPYVKLTLADRFPRVYVTRRIKKDGSAYYGPYLPASLAYKVVEVIHRHFLIPSCKIDLRRYHPRPCLQYYIGRCLGPCVEKLTTPEIYADTVKDVKLFLEGHHEELTASLTERMMKAAEQEQYELAAKYRDLISTVEQLADKQRMAAVDGDDADVFGYHYESGMIAVNVFHMRNGRVVDRREFFWDDLPELDSTGLPNPNSSDVYGPSVPSQASSERGTFNPGAFFAALLKQVYIDQLYVPHTIYVPVDFEEREVMQDLLSEKGRKVNIVVPQRGEKRSLVDLSGKNAKQSYDQRFRVLKPTGKVIAEALEQTLMLPAAPRRIECFDISHIQGAETVASMVVWEDGAMNKSAYRKFIIKTVTGVDDFASMREVISRRYKRVLDEKQRMPGLILIDGGLGQLHSTVEALESLGITDQSVASIAKREEIIYVSGQEDEPVVLEHHSPVLHLVQLIRDEAHRFAITFHRKRREIRDHSSELLEIPGIGATTMRRLLQHFGSLQSIRNADAAALTAVVNSKQAEAILSHFKESELSAGSNG